MAQQRASGKTGKKATSTKRPAAAATKTAKRPAPAKAKPAKPAKPAPKAPPKPKVAEKPPVAAPKKADNKVKNPSGLSKADLEHFRDLLLERRREILGDVGSMESEAFKAGSNLSNMPIHMADVGTDNFEQEFTLGLIESERQILREIQEALTRIESGSYGICQGTGKAIPKVRLEAVPWAKYSLEYAKALEQGLVRRDAALNADDDGEDDEE